MRCLVSVLCLPFLALPAVAETARFQFCWIGANGFTMEGIIGFPDRLLGTGILNGSDVTEFQIWGYHDRLPIGSWTLKDRTETTTWELYFDSTALVFPTGGYRLENSYQAWNANGDVNDCGIGGFGFNGGNYAQDVCIDNVWIEASSIDPATPFPVHGMDVELNCEAVTPMS